MPKRDCSPEKVVGENVYETGTIVDRDGRRHVWRDNKNIGERTKKLEVPFRVISHRRLHIFAPYGTLECSDYLRAIQFASTERVVNNHTVLKDAGLWHRIKNLCFLRSLQSFESFVQLHFEVSSTTPDVLTIASFSSGSELGSPKTDSTPVFRLAVAQALRHLAIAFIVIFSSKFDRCLDPLIDALEGRSNPFRVIKDDLLLHLINTVLAKWGWYVRMEYRAPNYPTISLRNPSGCALLLEQMIDEQLIEGLTGFQAYNEELLFRNQQIPFPVFSTTTPAIFQHQPRDLSGFVSDPQINYCAAHLLHTMGSQTNCVNSKCMFTHTSALTITKDQALRFTDLLNRKGRSRLGPELLSRVQEFTRWKK